ncbi:asparagine synthase (glutamine-hydrolyzing) [Reichenbachiella sp. 5M10]|uniref:asparagine synthase (glutamine-hydrolyzing) n=1 Tax=unclassified Reichenbachiella TaxID=2633076 RepID=UPI000C161D16|nr:MULTISPECIES: asparagine synthase (glutamine-hydrolyzing) [unclassified Reichenbachiella]PIB35497.1 asparagine synthase (glutamine-hydrolyzing) [Reichenbachiella sp. 5M10]RJE74902.1 asparagine synthase (glutamine-hydrolyzing) [Reichenbachiella sp. MSK19-1]
MCGITGYWKAGALESSAQQNLEKMTQMLYHRGPDGYGYHLDEPKGLAMGHARLSIIDLETGRQPLFANENKHVLTVNGEFYDYKRIRTNLRLEGFDFTTKSDSEIALPLYKKYGLDFVSHLRGEFAIAMYDEDEERLVLVRDRFGVKPLFYHIQNNNVFWGSEIKSLMVHPEVPRAFDSEAVLHQLMQTMVPGTTAYKDIQALRPGHMLIIERKGGNLEVKDHKYWDMDFPEEQDRDMGKSAEYHIQRVQEELVEAVEHRLEADVPVGCYLSGGIDSCSMLGLASSMQQSPVQAFTISFDNKDYDEAHIAKEMADRVGADQEQINLSAADLYGENYLKTAYHSERTFYNTLGVAKWQMSKKVNECGYRVVVTGEGSDELFGGYPQLKRDMLKYGYQNIEGSGHTQDEVDSYRELMEKTNSLFKGAILSEEHVSHPVMEEICGFTPSWIQPWMNTLEIARPLLHNDLIEELKDYDPVATIAQSFDTNQLNNRHVLDKAQYTWSKTMLECQILNWGGDRVDMANSMESRPAFLDHHVAEMAREIPPHYRIKGNTEKWVLREAMKDILPTVLYEREKFAFMSPPAHTEEKKKNALNELIEEYLNEDALRHAGIFDTGRLKRFITEYQNDKDPVSLVRKDALVNHILGLQILQNQFIDGKMLNL